MAMKYMQEIFDVDRDLGLWMLLFRTRDLLFKTRVRELRQVVGVTEAEAGVLSCISLLGGSATPTEISRYIVREPHSVSALLSRMEKNGLIMKVNDLSRKNLIRALMTDKGKRQYTYIEKRDSIHKIMALLSDRERCQLRLSMEKLCKGVLGDKGMEAPWP